MLLLDEPASALDPIATQKIEELMHELKQEYTLVIVTHNMQQAARVADRTAFFSLDVEDGQPHGVLVEYDETEKIFTAPPTSAPRTTSRALRMSNVRVTFQEELDQLEASLQEEGALVLRVLRGALNALGSARRRARRRGDRVRRRRRPLYLQIEEDIESLLARQTPVATDLRLVLAMLHINLHLERMADYAVTIAKLTKLVADVEADPTLCRACRRWASGPRR